MKVSPLISYKTAARVLALSGLMPVSLLPCIAFSLREINFARRCPCWLTAVPLIEGHAPAESGRYTETDQMCISRLISHLLPQLNAKQAACRDASRSAMSFALYFCRSSHSAKYNNQINNHYTNNRNDKGTISNANTSVLFLVWLPLSDGEANVVSKVVSGPLSLLDWPLGYSNVALMGFIRTLHTNTFQRPPKANQD